jgi:flagellum-specific ATP synthase
MTSSLATLRSAVGVLPRQQSEGRLLDAVGSLFEAELIGAAVGSVWEVQPNLLCEVVGFRGRRALLVPLESSEGAHFGARVAWRSDALQVPVGPTLLGRVVDGLGRPIDGKGPVTPWPRRPVTSDPVPAVQRARIHDRVTTGVRVIDGLMPLARGQRVAILAGSGVGKSTLLGQLARQVDTDVNVVCAVGERGREVREFLEENLGDEGMRRSVVVVATSDQSPAVQVRAAFTATAIAEAFRDDGQNVLLMVDSLTRLAMAQRQIGLASGEPPITRGYTPSVFRVLPELLERAGPGAGQASITALYTVLVEGDDIHDPIGDAVRGIADGHIVLSRRLASLGHYPAVDVLQSLSRLADRVCDEPHRRSAARFRALLATHSENEELIRLGAYRRGSSAEVDAALERMPAMTAFLRQDATNAPFADTRKRLKEAAGV